jgi:hypothetical protein
VGTLALKLGAVAAVLTLALARLPLRRAQVAICLALVLSLIGPSSVGRAMNQETA